MNPRNASLRLSLSTSLALAVAIVSFGVAEVADAQAGQPEPSAAPTGAPSATESAAPVDTASTAPAAAAETVVPVAPAPTVASAPAAAAAPAAPEEPHARLDYSDGTFYLRSANDNIIFVPSGRVHIDTYGFAGRGVSDYHRANGTGLRTNIFFRRFVLEFGGLIRKKWFYWIGGNFAPTTVDGTQSPMSTANVYDGFIGYAVNPHMRLYFGQYNAPFTMENVTSSRWLDFMERSIAVRNIGAPYNKTDGLTLWGETANRSFEYQVAVVGGDGMNRPNIDNRFDGMSRFVFRPLANRSDELRRFHVGVGARVGSRDPRFALYDTPSLTTPGGYAFWQSTYKMVDSTGSTRTIHVLQDGTQAAASAEFYLPFRRWDIRGEAIYVHENRREVDEAAKTATLRRGTLQGVGAYGQVSMWLHGTPRVNGQPAGLYGIVALPPNNLGAQAHHGLQLLLRGEFLHLSYNGNARSGVDSGTLSATTHSIRVNTYQAALNYWATRHIRLTAEYTLYSFPGNAGSNQAVAPGVRAGTVPGANLLSEFSLRLGLAL